MSQFITNKQFELCDNSENIMFIFCLFNCTMKNDKKQELFNIFFYKLYFLLSYYGNYTVLLYDTLVVWLFLKGAKFDSSPFIVSMLYKKEVTKMSLSRYIKRSNQMYFASVGKISFRTLQRHRLRTGCL